MLKNLLKYDLKYVYSVLVVFISLALFFSIVERILANLATNSLIFDVASKISSGFAFGMMVSILINCFMRNWVRFKNNIYGDESYLTHTLPVKKETIYLSKFLSAVITMLTSVFVIIVCLFIMYYSKENLEAIKQALKIFSSMYNSTVLEFIGIVFIAFFLEMLALLLIGYTGIILGHRINDNKLAYSIIIGFVFYIITQIITLLSFFIIGLFNNNIMKVFTTSNGANINVIKVIIFAGIILYIIYNFIYYFIDKKVLAKGVNVD